MDYDVLVIGGGITGCSVAYEMSKYNLNIAVIEKDFDIADDISFVNTSIVYDGFETSIDEMAYLEMRGSKLVEDACKKLKVTYKKTGAIRIADNEESVKKLEKMYDRAIRRGIDKVHLIDAEEALKIEPNIDVEFKKALYSENIAIIAPYDLAIAYAEVAAENGVIFRFEEEVINISDVSRGFRVTTNKNKFTCKVVINTITNDVYMENEKEEASQDNNTDSIYKNMSYYLIDSNFEKKLKNIVIKVLDDNNFILSTPSISGGSIVGIKNPKAVDIDRGMYYDYKLIQQLKKNNINNIFNDKYNKDMILIDDTCIDKGYIRVTGTHYGKITLAPAIAKTISDSIANNLNSTEKKEFIDKRRELYRFREMTDEERNEIISVDKRYGNVVCLCNQVTEGEIVDAIRRPLGARTIEGIKRRTGAGLGSCHGSYCVRKMINILSREMDKKPTEIVEDSK